MAISGTLPPVTHHQGCSGLHSAAAFAWTSKGIRVFVSSFCWVCMLEVMHSQLMYINKTWCVVRCLHTVWHRIGSQDTRLFELYRYYFIDALTFDVFQVDNLWY